jgi:hypothetical protein
MKKILVFLAIILNIRVDDKCTIISAEPRRHRKFAARKRCEIPLVTIQKTCVLMGTHHVQNYIKRKKIKSCCSRIKKNAVKTRDIGRDN